MAGQPGGLAAIGDDTWRDAYALVIAVLRDDYDGQDAILGNADLRMLALGLAGVASGAIGAYVQISGAAATPEEGVEFAEQLLAAGLRNAGVWHGP